MKTIYYMCVKKKSLGLDLLNQRASNLLSYYYYYFFFNGWKTFGLKICKKVQIRESL